MSNSVGDREAWVVDSPEGINYVKLLTLAHGLAFEVEFPGMKFPRWALTSVCKRDGISNKRSKVGCLRDVVALLELFPGYERSESIKRALLSDLKRY